MNRNQDDEINTGSPENRPMHVKAEVSRSNLSVAVAIGQINLLSVQLNPEPLYGDAPQLAHAQLDWLLGPGSISFRKLERVIKLELLYWDEQAGKLIYRVRWQSWLTALLLVLAIMFCLVNAGWLIACGQNTYERAALTGALTGAAALSMWYLNRRFLWPRCVAMRAARKLRSAGF